jgi:hypothetical protein
MRHAWVALLPSALAVLPLGGCLPPAVTVASYAADGASYVVSDKSLSDHGLSAVKGKDCATWHFFVGRAVCEDPANPLPTASLDEHRRDGSVKHAAAFTRQKAGDKTGTYIAVGSFAERANAERLAARYAAYNPRIVAATIDGKPLLRVVLGPLDATQRANLQDHGTNGFVVDAPAQAGAADLWQARASARIG